jgi:hypothetical protein
MTEHEWLREADWRPMLDHLAGRIGKRKGTLYVCGGLRTIWDLLYADASREAVEVAERAADGAATDEEISCAARYAEYSVWEVPGKFRRTGSVRRVSKWVSLCTPCCAGASHGATGIGRAEALRKGSQDVNDPQ